MASAEFSLFSRALESIELHFPTSAGNIGARSPVSLAFLITRLILTSVGVAAGAVFIILHNGA